MRDNRKSNSYFEKHSQKQVNGIKLFNTAFENGGKGQLTKEKSASVIYNYHLSLLISKYSTAEDNRVLKEIFINSLDFIKYNDFRNFYVQSLWLLSIAYVLEIDSSEIEVLKQKIEENDYNDYLIGTLLEAVFGDSNTSNNFTFETPYSKLRSVLDLKSLRI